MSKIFSVLLLEVFTGVIISAILIAWYDTFCERKDKQKKFIISTIWYITISVLMKYGVEYVLQRYFTSSEITKMIITTTQLVFEIILEWFLFVNEYKGDLFKKSLLYTPYILIIPALELFALSIMDKNLVTARNGSYYIEMINNVTMLIAMYLVILIIGKVYRFIKYKKSDLHFVFFATILLAQLILHYFFEKAFLTIVDEGNMNLCLIGYTFSAAILLSVSAIYQNHLKALEYKRFERERQRVWEQRVDYYQSTSKSTTELRKMEHDFKTHLLIIAQLARSNNANELDRYLKSVVDHASPSTKIIAVSNPVVSAVLTLMMARCQKNDIDFKYNLQYKELQMADFDLSTILGNVLENAFEASIKVADVLKRSIKLSIQKERGIVLIGCSNYFTGTIGAVDKNIKSSKADKSNHGLGLSNIQDIAKKYDGEVNVETNQQTFEIHVILQESVKNNN